MAYKKKLIEVALPLGGGLLQLRCTSRTSVVVGDLHRGPPDGDVPEDAGIRSSGALPGPHRRGSALGGGSDLGGSARPALNCRGWPARERTSCALRDLNAI